MSKLNLQKFAPVMPGKSVVYRCLFLVMFSGLSWFCKSEVHPLYQQGAEQFNNEKYDSAVATFSQLIDSFPLKKEGFYNRGLSFYGANNFRNALADFITCLKLDSSFEDAQFMKGMALQQQGKLELAIVEFKKLDTKYTGYNDLEKRIRYCGLCVSISRYWYYMIAILFISIVLITIVARTLTYRKG